jgi:hypothetical protein
MTLLSRTDNVFAVGVLLGYLFWRDRNFTVIAKAAAAAGLLFAPWLIFNALEFGSIMQTSGAAYPWLYHQQYLSEHNTYYSWTLVPYLLKLGFYSFVQNAFHYGNWILTAIVAGFLLFRLRNRPQKYRPLVWTLAAACVFMGVHTFIRWSVRPWYPQAAFVLTLPLVALTLEKVRRAVLGLGFVVVLFFSGWAVWSQPFRIAYRSIFMEDIVNRIPAGERVGAFNSGYLQYFTDRKVINLDGLVNNEVLPYYRENKGLEYFRNRNIGWLVDRAGYFVHVFGPYFGPAAESSLAVVASSQDTVYTGQYILTIRVLPEGMRPPPERVLQRFYRPAPITWGPVPIFKPKW